MNNIFILPISGTDFVRYVSIYSRLSEINLKPNVILCASGGCIASYIAMMSSFTSNVEKWFFSPEMFIKKSTPVTPRLLTMALNGYFYRRQDIDDYMRKLFTYKKIQDVEIISGYFETKAEKSRIIIGTNYREKDSFLKGNTINVMKSINFLYQREKKETESDKDYLSEVMNNSLDIINKTTNIPILIEPLGENESVDFGIVSPSPMDFVKTLNGKVFYFSPINLDKDKEDSLYKSYFRNLIIKDICIIKQKYKVQKDITDLMEFKNFYDSTSNFSVVIYVSCDIDLNIESFTYDEFERAIKLTKSYVKFMVFY
jgi:hypothetical protein